MDRLEKLNAFAKEAGYDDIFPRAIIVEPWGESTSTTTIFDKDQSQPFTLNPIVAGRFKDFIGEKSKVPSDYKGLVAVHRALISIEAVSRINTLADFKSTFDRIINVGVIDLINQVGFINPFRCKISMKLPCGNFFQHAENSAAYEIRISVIKE